MKKVEITADAILKLLKGIFEDEDVNFVISDNDASESSEWRGKTVNEVLNIEYYTFKHRPSSNQTILNDIAANAPNNKLEALTRSFCLLSISNIERLYSKNEDMVAVDVLLEYYVQTEKVKLLEKLIECSSAGVSGLRFDFDFVGGEFLHHDASHEGIERRKAVVFFGALTESDVLPTTPFGEMVGLEIKVSVMFYPPVYSYSDYTASFTFADEEGLKTVEDMPLKSISIAHVMTQEAVPNIENNCKVGAINLSGATSFVLVFDGYDNDFIDYLADMTLNCDITDNNMPINFTLKRGEKAYTHIVVIKDHKMVINADTGNETHTLTLVRSVSDDGRR